jgi:hypothetical protein
MDFASARYLLLFFTCDKTFDIREVCETSFQRKDFEHLLKGNTVKVTTSYDGENVSGTIIQVGSTEHCLTPYMDECVFFKEEK